VLLDVVIMMLLVQIVSLLLSVCCWTPLSEARLVYPIVSASTRQNRQLQGSTLDEQAISFDGDVNYIKLLALKKAQGENFGEDKGPSSSPSPFFNPFECTDAGSQFLNVLTWQYSIEYNATANAEAIIAGLERALQAILAPLILSCVNPDAESANVVAEDSLPKDLPSQNGMYRRC
jgi:hypothetical protein